MGKSAIIAVKISGSLPAAMCLSPQGVMDMVNGIDRNLISCPWCGFRVPGSDSLKTKTILRDFFIHVPASF
jgi:hypothetical protein